MRYLFSKKNTSSRRNCDKDACDIYFTIPSKHYSCENWTSAFFIEVADLNRSVE